MIISTVELPSAYPGHAHATEEARQIAQDGLILLAEVGSGVHGTSISGTDDQDLMGICIEPPQYVTGLRRFEQFERHTAWDRPGGLANRSGAGDLDVTIYSARKFTRLAADGNPSIITLLFAPESSIVFADHLGRSLLDNRDMFFSMRACSRFLGYLVSQKRGMVGTGRTNRPELVALHGYDSKFAGHAVRLGAQGVELMSTGEITLPMAPSWREYITAIRRGEVPLADVEARVADLQDQLLRIRETNPYGAPEEPDQARIDRWLHRAYTQTWAKRVLRDG